MPIRTQGPEAFLRTCREMLERLERGDVVAFSAHFEAVGIGRVSGTTSDGSFVRDSQFDTSDIDDDGGKEGEDDEDPERTGDTAPGKRSAQP